MLFIGNSTLCKWLSSEEQNQKSLAIKLLYDLINWFGMSSNIAKVTEFKHKSLNLSEKSQCKKALSTAHFTSDHVREGSLVLVSLDIQENMNGGWNPIKTKKYTNFE